MDTKIKFDVEYSSVRELQKAIKSVKDEMVGLEAGTDEFRQAALRAGELKHQMDEINESVRGASSDFGDMLGNITNVGAGITGAFQAAQGAMNLFGVESENVTEAIAKMQNLMAMTQGLAAIDEGIKAFGKLTTAIGLSTTAKKEDVAATAADAAATEADTAAKTANAAATNKSSKALGGFKKALIGTGIGAVVIILGSLIANWEEFTKEIGLSQEQLNKFGEVFQGTINVILGSTKKIASSFAKVIKGDFSGAWEELKSGWDFQQMYAEGVQKAITDREKAELKKRQEEHQKYIDKRNAQLDTERSKAEATIEDETKLNEELVRIETERLKLYKEGSKEYYDQLKKIQDLEKDEVTRQKQLADNKQKQLDKENADYQKELDNINKRTQTLIESFRNELQVINDIETQKLALIQQALDNQLISQEEFENLKTQIVQEAENKRKEISDRALEDTESAMSQTLSRINQVGQIAFGALGDTLSAFAEMQDTTTKQGFEQQKKLQIASVTMNMLGGVLSAWTSAMNPANAWMTLPGQIAMGIAETTATLAMGAAQIAKIKQQKFDGGGSGASSGAANVSVSRSAQNINIPVQYTQDVQGSSIEAAIKDTKVYVTEADISNTQTRVNVAESENRY